MKVPFKPYKCTEDQMKSLPIVDGQLIFTTDTNKIYVDDGGSRKEYTPDSTKVFVSNEQPVSAKNGDIWLILDNN